MPVKLIDRTPEAYGYPLLIKQLLHTPLAIAPDREITYMGGRRHSYRTMRARIGRLASGLSVRARALAASSRRAGRRRARGD